MKRMKQELPLPNGIDRGNIVKDHATGQQAQVGAICFQNTGSTLVEVIADLPEDGEAPKSRYVDYHCLERLEDGVRDRLEPMDDRCDIDFGDKVEDVVSGFKGIVVESLLQRNGCIAFCVQPKLKKGEEEMPAAKFVDQHQLKVIKKRAIETGQTKTKGGSSLGIATSDRSVRP